MVRLVLLALFALVIGCTKAADEPAPEAPAPSPLNERTLLLSLAQFEWETTPTGARKPKPGAARLMLVRQEGDGFVVQTLDDPDSRVFHKTSCVAGERGPDLLTIGGTDALLKRWRWENGWKAEVLWRATFGGKWDRLRDFELGDVTGDGKNDVVVATHDQGVVAVVTRKKDGWHAAEIAREPDTFVHEVELGDVDRDGKPEIYTTPSHPNRADASQRGDVAGFRRTGDDAFERVVVASFAGSHAKEILLADVDGDGGPELYAAVEAERGVDGQEKKPVRVVQLVPPVKGKQWTQVVVGEIPGGIQARVLLAADLTGRGAKDIVVTTMKGGIYRLWRDGKTWQKAVVSTDTSGFEHAAVAVDLDGNGQQELYVAGDDQDQVRRLRFENGQFTTDTVAELGPSDLVWNIVPCRPQPL